MKHGYVIKLGGDAEIANALAAGVIDGTKRARGSDAERPTAGRAERQPIGWAARNPRLPQAVAWGDAIMRVAVYHGRGSAYWTGRIDEARRLYGRNRRAPRALRGLLSAYALLVYAYGKFWEYEERRWKA